jgi:hypothetical protein
MGKPPKLAEPGFDPGTPVRASGRMPGPAMKKEPRK